MTPNLNPKIIPLWDGGDSHIRKWWLNPFNFVDVEDVLRDQRAAYVFFLDLLVNRPTEFKALLLLYMLSCDNLDEDQTILTNRQTEAVSLAREAMASGQPPIIYISKQMGIHKSNASRLLKRAGQRIEIATFTDLFAVYDSGEQQISWSPSEQQIQQQKAKLTRQCAASGTPGCKGTTRGQFALCLPCSDKYGKTREEWVRPSTGEPAIWLLEEARRIDKQVREEAINLLYRSHIGYDEERLERIA